VVVEVFHSSDGHPLLIHIAAASERQAKGVANAGTGTILALRGQAEGR
jgi:hypothetical protein